MLFNEVESTATILISYIKNEIFLRTNNCIYRLKYRFIYTYILQKNITPKLHLNNLKKPEDRAIEFKLISRAKERKKKNKKRKERVACVTSVTEVANESSLDRRCILHHRGERRGDEKISGRFHRAERNPSATFPRISPSLSPPHAFPPCFLASRFLFSAAIGHATRKKRHGIMVARGVNRMGVGVGGSGVG